MKLNNVVYFIEITRANDPDTVYDKIDKYVRLSDEFPNEGFHVLFSVLSYRRTAIEMADDILTYAQGKKRGWQFLTAIHDDLVKDPLGKVVKPPDGDDENWISLLDVRP